jgi:hypothetical protein
MDAKPSLVSTFLVGDPDANLYHLASTQVTPNIDLTEAIQLAEHSPLWSARGMAIQSYAILEQALCFMLESHSDMSKESAHVVFYKITNYRARNDILDKLIKQKHGSKYSLFWNSYFKQLGAIDLSRNELIHWLSAATVAKNQLGQTIVGVVLVAPQSLPKAERGEQRTLQDITLFTEKCSIFARLCTQFCLLTKSQDLFDNDQAWQRIYQQALTYPLPLEHPLFQTADRPQTPPPPSQA